MKAKLFLILMLCVSALTSCRTEDTHEFVEGVDYINPALEPIFQQLADELWEEVTSVGNYH